MVIDERPPDRLLSTDGRSGWYAFSPHGNDADQETWEPPAEGSVIRFMGEDGVEVPLWGDDGLTFGERGELVREFGVSAELADDIAAWAARWQTGVADGELDQEAARLVRRLNHELDYRYTFVYRP